MIYYFVGCEPWERGVGSNIDIERCGVSLTVLVYVYMSSYESADRLIDKARGKSHCPTNGSSSGDYD
jgi:hypothetical protein